MSTEVQNRSDQSLASLVGGIVSDVQDLVKHQLQLTRKEIEEDVRKAGEGAALFGTGLGVLFLGGVELCLMLAHLLHWSTAPPGTDPASFPLWACHGVVGAILFIFGWSVVCAGKKKLQAVAPPLDQSAQALKENVEWMTNPK
jgi:hypothetical protein